MKLIDNKTDHEIKIGSKRKTFRGEVMTVKGFTPPRHAGSTGRVHLVDAEGNEHEFYPGVIGAEIVEA